MNYPELLRQVRREDPLTTPLPCVVHRYHSPLSPLNHQHHVVPLSWDGPDEASNLIVICPTGHTKVHVILSMYKRLGGEPPWDFMEHFAEAERDLARRGWDEGPYS